MCGGGGRRSQPDDSAQRESLRLQQEQLELARQAQARQEAQYQEQLRIASAPPPPAPAPVAEVAASALGAPASTAADGTLPSTDNQASFAQARQGYGRRRLRTDAARAGGTGGLSIPAA